MVTFGPDSDVRRKSLATVASVLAGVAVIAALVAAVAHVASEVSQRLDAQLWTGAFWAQQPNADNTGVPGGVTLTVLDRENVPYGHDGFEDGVFTIRTAGAVYEGWQFNNRVEVAAPDVRFRNCLFAGGRNGGAGAALLKVLDDGPGAVGIPSAQITESTFRPRIPDARFDGVRGSHFTLDRVEISGTVDGAHVHGASGWDPHAGNVLILRSWIHDLTHFDDDSHKDGTHNDGVQIVGGRNIAIVASRIDGEIYNAAIMVTQGRSEVSDVSIYGNWLAGGACTVNIYDGGDAIPDLNIRGNAFLKDSQRREGCDVTISNKSLAAVDRTGSRWVDYW